MKSYPSLDEIISRNVSLIAEIEAASHERRTLGEAFFDGIADFCGSMTFFWVQCFWFGLWLIWNLSPAIHRTSKFDPAPSPMLKLAVSLEAIFLSTFISINQNRQRVIFDEHSHLDLQINMLAEQETSPILAMLRQIHEHLGIESPQQEPVSMIEAFREDTDVKRVIKHIEGIPLTPTVPKRPAGSLNSRKRPCG